MDFIASRATGVFINYRRLLDLPTAGRLFDNLKHALPDTNIFMDVDSLPAGRDFVVELGARISQCDLFLIVISPTWISASNSHGIRRLDDPEDFVRFEIETALRFQKPIIPVLIGEAKMPNAHELPQSIARITRFNALTVRHESFQRDCSLLADQIKPSLTTASTISPKLKVELEAFRAEPNHAQRIVAEHPVGWEYLLIAELLEEYLKVPLRQLSDLSSGLYSMRRVPLGDDKASLDWIGVQIGAAVGMLDPLQKLMSVELKRAWGAPGVPGDPREILHVCKLMQRSAQVLVEWEENVRSREVTPRLKKLYDFLPGIAARQICKIKGLPQMLKSCVEYALAHPGMPHEMHFEVEFDLPDGWQRQFERELSRLNGGGWKWW